MQVLPPRWRPAERDCEQRNWFSCVSSTPSRGIKSARWKLKAGVLTRVQRTSSLAQQTPLLPGLTAGKTACHGPAAATAGFLLSSLEQHHKRLHSYRRRTLPECFARFPSFFCCSFLL